MSRLCFPALLIPLLLGAALPVRAELQIEIIKPNEQAPQIGVTPFAEGNDLSTIIQNDLRRSGRFASSASLPQTVYRSADLDPGLWQQAQIPYAVVGRVTPQGDDLLIQYELMDINKSQRLLGEQLTVSKARQREAAHLIADKIYQALTGVAGDFSGRIAYVLRENPSLRRPGRWPSHTLPCRLPTPMATNRGPCWSPANRSCRLHGPRMANRLPMCRLKAVARPFTCRRWKPASVRCWPSSRA